MRRLVLMSLSVVLLAAGACSSKPKNGECKSSDDCKDQQGFGAVCVDGRCQECGADTDCQAGFTCQANKCAPRPECTGDTDCGAGKACEAGRCVASAPKPECDSDAACGSGQACQAGKCVAQETQAQAMGCGGEERAVLFGFDKADLNEAARGTLGEIAECLKSAPGPISVEGHCDERGTTEYNVHLGQRRAEAVKRYLVNLGVDAMNVKTTSYGKERPVCTENDESCWSKNRRAVVVAAGSDAT